MYAAAMKSKKGNNSHAAANSVTQQISIKNNSVIQCVLEGRDLDILCGYLSSNLPESTQMEYNAHELTWYVLIAESETVSEAIFYTKALFKYIYMTLMQGYDVDRDEGKRLLGNLKNHSPFQPEEYKTGDEAEFDEEMLSDVDEEEQEQVEEIEIKDESEEGEGLIEEDEEFVIPTVNDYGILGIQTINASAESAFNDYKTMYQAIKNKDNPQSFKEQKKKAISGIETLSKIPNQPPKIIVNASKVTNAFLKANKRALFYRDTKGLQDKKIHQQAEENYMHSLADKLLDLANINVAKPTGTKRTPGPVISEQDAKGTNHKLATSYEIITGRKGGQEGTDAFTMSASQYLSDTYGLQQKNQMIAGHLVTRKAGGKAEDDNLSPFPSYDFNQTTIREPEIKAEQMIRADKVFKYSANVTYGRTSNDGSSVNFNQQDLKLIGKSVGVQVEEYKLPQDRDGTKINNWVGDKTVYNKNLPIILTNVVSGDNTARADNEDEMFY